MMSDIALRLFLLLHSESMQLNIPQIIPPALFVLTHNPQYQLPTYPPNSFKTRALVPYIEQHQREERKGIRYCLRISVKLSTYYISIFSKKLLTIT